MERSDRSTPVRHSPLSWACRLALAGVWLAAWAPASEAQTTSLSPRYRFKMMLGGPGYQATGGAATVIDDFGRIATDVYLNGVQSLVRTDGTVTEVIADTDGPIDSFEHPHAYLQMNANGTVAFLAKMDSGGQAVFTWDGATLTQVMDSETLPWPSGPYSSVISDLSINAAGSVVCAAIHGQSAPAVFLNDGASTSLVVEGHCTSFWDCFRPWYVRLLDDGTIATEADGWMPQLRCEPLQWYATAILRLSPTGGILETLASTTSDDTIVLGAQQWSANNSGDVLYRGGCWQPSGSQNIVLASGGLQHVVASGTAGPWHNLQSPCVSNSGQIAFTGVIATGMGSVEMVADGPDPVRNRVLGTGDVIFGKTVDDPQLRFRDAINASGQICMYVVFTDGTDAIVRADPRPLRRL